ncbi:hypothetical protein V490_02425 [Pseudogymnoascus sp. VKM F-3557]|nr:hypothetical protein V490_02425 [Pseudogymnoascus sp. VKM F-3557]
MKAAYFNLELVASMDVTGREAEISNILDALTLGMQPAMLESAEQAACQLDFACPPLESNKEASGYLWNIWEVMGNIAGSPSATIEIQKRLVVVLKCLQKCAKGDLRTWSGGGERVWADLPLFTEVVYTFFNDPMQHGGELTPEYERIWRNANTFAGLCLAAGFGGPHNQIVYAIRVALEEPITDSEMHKTECRILIACDWITHGGKALLKWAQANIGYIVDENDPEGQYIDQGSLYHEPPTMCLGRWGYWQDRFMEIGKEGSGLGEDMRRAAREAAEQMRVIEREVGHTLSKSEV